MCEECARDYFPDSDLELYANERIPLPVVLSAAVDIVRHKRETFSALALRLHVSNTTLSRWANGYPITDRGFDRAMLVLEAGRSDAQKQQTIA